MSELGQVKVGDVLVSSHRGHGMTKCVVTKVLPSGRFRVGNMLFDSDGWQRGGDIWNRTYLKKFNQEDWDKYQDRVGADNMRSKLREYAWKDVPKDALISIFQVLEAVNEHRTLGSKHHEAPKVSEALDGCGD